MTIPNNGSTPRGRPDPCRPLPRKLLPGEPRRPRRRLGAGHHGAAEGTVVRAQREAGHGG